MGVALVSGITGQDGSYLAELLLSKGYEVHGIIRRTSSPNTWRIDHILGRLHMHYGDVTDAGFCMRVVAETKPDELYNLAGQSHVRVSFDGPVDTFHIDAMGPLHLLEAVRHCSSATRFYQASSSEMFGSHIPPQSVATPLSANSPYAAAKIAAHELAGFYRRAYGLYVVRGILFNHESPRRDERFVTRKITAWVGRQLAGQKSDLYLGNPLAKRDWGYAPEYVEGMWRMLQQPTAGDYTLATGVSASVRDWLQHATFDLHQREDCPTGIGGDIHWETERYLRDHDVDHLRGETERTADLLGWRPVVKWRELCTIMVEHDARIVRDGTHGAIDAPVWQDQAAAVH